MKSTLRASKRLLAIALFVLGLLPSTAQATSVAKLGKMPAFLGLAYAIARVNNAMRDAANNPMDDFRRENVRVAIRAMPDAIRGLAMAFQQGKLHDFDLPYVQAMLGGFVDVNAADTYKKFLQNPDSRLIPRVGADMPANLMALPNGPGDPRLGYDDNAPKNTPSASGPQASVGKDPQAATVDPIPDPSLLDAPPSLISSSASGLDDGKQLGFDDSVQKAVAPLYSQSSGSADASRDIASAQAAVDADQGASSDDKSFFGLSQKKVNPSTYQAPASPKYWLFGSIIHAAEALVIHDAHAGGNNCKDCDSGGGGGGGGGGNAAGILFGLAAIMAAIAPVMAASIQAKADVQMAQIQANTNKYDMAMSVQNSETLAQMQSASATNLANISATSAANNNAGVTQRLDMQLASLDSARQAAQASEQQKLALENQYNQERITLAEQQASQNVLLAKETLSNELELAGLKGGGGAVPGASSSELAVSRNPQANGFVNPNNSLASLNGGGPGATGVSTGNLATGSTTSSDGQTSAGTMANLFSGASQGKPASSLTSVTESADEETDAQSGPVKKAAAKLTKSATAARNVASTGVQPTTAAAASVSPSLLATLRSAMQPMASIVGGSSRPATAVTTSATNGGDISSFIASSNSSFGAYLQNQAAAAPAASGSARPATSH